jgi:hypothetical protein
LFIRSKPAGGRTYYQVVEGYRDNGRVRHRTLASLGTNPTIEKARTVALKKYHALPRGRGILKVRDFRDRMAEARRQDAWSWVLLLDDLARQWHTQKGTAYQQDATIEEVRREREAEEQKRHAEWDRQRQRSEKDSARRKTKKETKDREWREEFARMMGKEDRQQTTEEVLENLAALGIQLDQKAIQAAYHRKSRECHPDHGGSDEAMANLNNAYDSLKGLITSSRRSRREAPDRDPK